VYVSTAGLLGVGTTSPLSKLDVRGAVNIRDTAPTLQLDRAGAYTWKLINGDGTTYPLSTLNVANNGNAAIMTFLDSGNVGIGTTSPAEKLQVDGTVVTDYTIADTQGYRLIKPRNGTYVTQTSTVTGAIKITYPVGYTNTMHTVKVKVYEYEPNESFTITFGGYNYAPSPAWVNCFAYIEGNPAIDRNFNVRFGYDGTYMVVYIGELSSTWTYPQVFIEEVGLGYSGITTAWRNNSWGVGFEASAFSNVTETISNTAAHTFVRNGANAYYSLGNVGIGTTSPAYRLDVAGGSAAFRRGISAPRMSSAGEYTYGITNSPSWIVSLATIVNNNSTAPDGTTTAGTYTLNAASYDAYQTFTGITTGVEYTVGVWVRLGTATNFCIVVNNTLAWNSIGGKAFNSNDGLSTSKWTHVSFTFVGPASGQINLHVGGHAESITQQTAGTVFLWNWEITTGASTWIGKVDDEIRLPGNSIWDSRGNVGINSTSPSNKLHVNGDVLFSSTIDQILTLNASDSSWCYIGYSWAGSRRFYTGLDNSGRYAFGSDTGAAFYFTGGNVGIGTSSPSTGTLQINTGAANNNALTIQASSQTTITYGIGIDASSNFAIYDNFAASQRVTMNGSGNVGIGGAPNHKLDIFGNIAAEAGQAEDITTRIKGGFWETNSATTAEGWPVTTNSWYHLISSTHSNTGNYYSLQIAGDFSSQDFYIRSTADQGSRAWSRLMLGSGTTNYVPKFTAANTLGDSIIYDNGTSIGIGNPSPTYKLDVVNTGAGIIRAKGGSTGYVQAALILQSDTADAPQARGLGVYTFNEGTDATWYFGNGYNYGDYFVINRKSGTTLQGAAANPAESSNFVSIDNTGNVGIGTPTPGQKLDVIGRLRFRSDTSTTPGFWLTGNSGTENVFVGLQGATSTDSFGVYSDGSWRFTILNGGNVGIGTQSPSSKLSIEGGAADWDPTTPGLTTGTIHLTTGVTTDNFGNAITFAASDSGGAQAGIYIRSDGTYGTKMYFATTDSYAAGAKTRAMIDAIGNFGIGTASPSYPLHVAGKIYSTGDIQGIGTGYFGGDVIAYYSDKRLKTKIRPIESALDKISRLGGYYYEPNELALQLKAEKDVKQKLGLIAQEIQKEFPEAIERAPFDMDDNGGSKSGEDYLTVKYERLVPVLIEAIKELHELIKNK
jgi:hypothetical protein